MSGLDWQNEAYPVLRAVYDLIRKRGGALGPDQGISQIEISRSLGRDGHDPATRNTLRTLEEGGYVTDVYSPDPHWRPQFVGLAQKGREIVTGWPSGPADALLSALVSEVDRGIEEAHTEDERSRLRRFREFLLGAGRDVVVGVLTRYADRATGSLG